MICSTNIKLSILDDERVFLDSLKLYFSNKLDERISFNLFCNSSELFTFISETSYIQDSYDEIINSFYSQQINEETIKNVLFDLSKASSIAIIDQNLGSEDISGLEIIEKIRLFFPKTHIGLLTSVIDDREAIELHNNSTIDYFINKSDAHAINKLEKFINQKVKIIKDECNVDFEDIYSNAEISNIEHYEIDLINLLSRIKPLSHIVTSSAGNISLLLKNNNIEHYIYNDKDRKFNK